MGCDGGTIPRRDELVRVKRKPEQVRKIDIISLTCKSLNCMKLLTFKNYESFYF